jgi:hypothetical protein
VLVKDDPRKTHDKPNNKTRAGELEVPLIIHTVRVFGDSVGSL